MSKLYARSGGIGSELVGTTAYYVVRAVGVLAGAGFLWLIASGWMVLPFGAPWESHGNLLAGLGQVWFIFVWGFGVTLVVGLVNAWFGGMVMFWLMFHYGLWTAIVAHILYDICVFTSRAIADYFRPEDRLRSLFLGLFTPR